MVTGLSIVNNVEAWQGYVLACICANFTSVCGLWKDNNNMTAEVSVEANMLSKE